MIVAVTVIMVLLMISTALFSRSVSEFNSVRQGQDYANALGGADAGISDALFFLDQQVNSPPSSFCVGGSPGQCNFQTIPGAPGVQYKATLIENDNVVAYKLVSEGVVNGVAHAVQTTAWARRTFPFAIYSNQIIINGNSGTAIHTYNSLGAQVSSPPSTIATGSTGSITCHPSSNSPAQYQAYFPGGTVSCANAVGLSGTYNPQNPVLTCPAPANTPPTPCLPSTYSACPAVNGVLPPILSPGVYWCNQNAVASSGNKLSFSTATTLGSGSANNGEVDIYVIPTDSTSITVSIANDTINYGGNPSKLRVYLSGGQLDPGNGSNGGIYYGVMYAPTATYVNPGCQATWFGVIVASASFVCNGGPNLNVSYSTTVANVYDTPFKEKDYTEIPASQFSLS